MTDEEIKERISQRRRQMLVHSILYYRFHSNIIPDHKWAEWARELVALQAKYPKIAEQAPLAEAFKDFDASTGYDLPLRDPHYVAVAKWLLEYHERRNS